MRRMLCLGSCQFGILVRGLRGGDMGGVAK